MVHSDADRAERFRQRANEIRIVADETPSLGLRLQLFVIAAQYESLAEQFDVWRTIRREI